MNEGSGTAQKGVCDFGGYFRKENAETELVTIHCAELEETQEESFDSIKPLLP